MSRASEASRTALWAVISHAGQPIAIKSVNDERMCLALFTHPLNAVAWIHGMGLQNVDPSFPLRGKVLRAFLEQASEHGLGLAAINPPARDYGYFSCAPIEKLVSQVEARL